MTRDKLRECPCTNVSHEGATPENEQFPHCYIGDYTFSQWKILAQRDCCLDEMMPSDLRQILSFAEKMQNCAQYWRDSTAATRAADEKIKALVEALEEIAFGYNTITESDCANVAKEALAQLEGRK